MDTESNYESDLSESWSLIDINVNEESLISTDASSILDKSHTTVLNNIDLRELNEADVKNSVRKGKDLKEMDFSDFDSDSDFDVTSKNQDTETYKKNRVQSLQTPVNDEKNDSGDAESIEILDMEENYQGSEIERLDASVPDHFDFATYQSDDEESSSGSFHIKGRSNNLTVIRRKRRRVSRDLGHSGDFLISDNSSISDTNVVSNKLVKANNHPVYKHYRNNVANTVLSLSVGVIFAGVACIAIGHFLGVQDAADTVVELVETLKKLQVENAALQSSMTHLKKALFTLETNSKLELSLNQPQNKIATYEESPKINPSSAGFVKNVSQVDLNSAALSEICSYLNSIENLPEYHNTLKKRTEAKNMENDIHRLRKRIYDQIKVLKNKKKEGTKLLEDTDLLLVLKKLLGVVKMIMNKMSSSYDNTEVMEEVLMKLKNTVNHNPNQFIVDSPKRTERNNRVPVTELDLKAIQWTRNNEIHRDSEVSPESRVLYKFPQPQKYYEFETCLKPRSPNISSKSDHFENISQNKNKYQISEIEKNKSKNHVKKKKKQKEITDRKKDKKRKTPNLKKFDKKKSKLLKYSNSFPLFNRTDFSYMKIQEKDVKYKRKVKKLKKSKLKNFLLSKKVKKKSSLKEKYVPFCSEAQCFNLTGYWVFKWADGRKEFRRHQTLGDWQFDRAKARKDVRGIERSKNWQFERAKSREELRSEGFGENWQFKRASARQENRGDRPTHQEKFTKYSGKAFFQEKFL